MKTLNISGKGKPLNRKRVDPTAFVFTGHSYSTGMDVQLFEYNKELCNEYKEVSLEQLAAFEDAKHMYWLNIHGLNKADEIAAICQKLEIHNLVIQDILDVNQRPKFQEFDQFSFLTLKSIVPSENEMVTEQISFVFGQNYLISFQERKADYFEHLRTRLREEKGIIRERSVDFLLYSMLESILDNYFKTLNQLDEDINSIDFSDTNKDPQPNALETIETHKKFVQFIKKSILPIKEFAQLVERGDCKGIEKRHVKYFLEIKDLCLTLMDSCDILLSTLESHTNLFFSVQGHRMNQVMKTLTVVATIFIPLTFVVGVYGMNFSYMPELAWKYGYFGIWAIMLILFLLMLYVFKKKKWF